MMDDAVHRILFILLWLCVPAARAESVVTSVRNSEVLAARWITGAGSDPEIAALLERAIKAAGGEATLRKFKAARVKSKGTIYSADEKATYTAEWVYHGLRQLHFVSYYEKNPCQKLKLVEVIDGDQAWVRINDGPTEKMPEAETTARKETMYLEELLRLLPLKGGETVKGTFWILTTPAWPACPSPSAASCRLPRCRGHERIDDGHAVNCSCKPRCRQPESRNCADWTSAHRRPILEYPQEHDHENHR